MQAGLRKKVEPFFKKLQTKEAAFGVLLITAIAISLIAQDIGLHFVIGTFFSGLVIYKGRIGRQNFNKVYGTISAITFGFFAPIFFALIGIEFNVQSLVNAIPLFSALLGVAIVTKIAAGYIGAKIVGFSREVSLAIGFLMNGRGMVELVIASIGFASRSNRYDFVFNSSCNRACYHHISTTNIAPHGQQCQVKR